MLRRSPEQRRTDAYGRSRLAIEYSYPYRTFWPDALVTPKGWNDRLTALMRRGWTAGQDAALSRRPPAVTR